MVKTLLDAKKLKNMIHRDIKPQNILVKNDSYYISDFGLAKFYDDIRMN